MPRTGSRTQNVLGSLIAIGRLHLAWPRSPRSPAAQVAKSTTLRPELRALAIWETNRAESLLLLTTTGKRSSTAAAATLRHVQHVAACSLLHVSIAFRVPNSLAFYQSFLTIFSRTEAEQRGPKGAKAADSATWLDCRKSDTRKVLAMGEELRRGEGRNNAGPCV